MSSSSAVAPAGDHKHPVGAFESGDTLGVLLDLSEVRCNSESYAEQGLLRQAKGSLTFFRNGKYYSGLAVDDIPRDKPLFAAVSSKVRNQRDC